MLIPFSRGASVARQRLERAGAAAFLVLLIEVVVWSAATVA
jgi:hypothetical protein